jgi:hypothetical protein
MENGKPTRQFVIYQNKAQAPSNPNKDNFMCLPVPLKDGLDPKENILLYSFSSKGKAAAMKGFYEKFWDLVDGQFEPPAVDMHTTLDFASSSRARSSAPLEVVQVGGYKCSLARTPDDVLNADPSVFGKPTGLNDVLQANYPNNYAFLLCAFKQNKKEKIDFHPILYSFPLAQDGKFFIPTRHYHGSGNPASKYASDWDHKIYVFGARKGDIATVLNNSKATHLYNPKLLVDADSLSEGTSGYHNQQVLRDAFEGSDKDSIDLRPQFGWENSCKIEVKGRFDNIDFQPLAELQVSA